MCSGGLDVHLLRHGLSLHNRVGQDAAFLHRKLNRANRHLGGLCFFSDWLVVSDCLNPLGGGLRGLDVSDATDGLNRGCGDFWGRLYRSGGNRSGRGRSCLCGHRSGLCRSCRDCWARLRRGWSRCLKVSIELSEPVARRLERVIDLLGVNFRGLLLFGSVLGYQFDIAEIGIEVPHVLAKALPLFVCGLDAREPLVTDPDHVQLRCLPHLKADICAGLCLVHIDGSRGFVFAHGVNERLSRRACDRVTDVAVNVFVRFDIKLTFDAGGTKLFCGLSNAGLIQVSQVLGLLSLEVFLKLASAPKLSTGSKLDNTLNDGASECAATSIAEDILTDLYVRVVNPVLHEVVGDTFGHFLSGFLYTSLCDLRQTALDDLLDNTSLGRWDLAEDCIDWPEEFLHGQRLRRTEETAKSLRRNLLFGADLHAGGKLLFDCLGPRASTKRDALSASGSSASTASESSASPGQSCALAC